VTCSPPWPGSARHRDPRPTPSRWSPPRVLRTGPAACRSSSRADRRQACRRQLRWLPRSAAASQPADPLPTAARRPAGPTDPDQPDPKISARARADQRHRVEVGAASRRSSRSSSRPLGALPSRGGGRGLRPAARRRPGGGGVRAGVVVAEGPPASRPAGRVVRIALNTGTSPWRRQNRGATAGGSRSDRSAGLDEGPGAVDGTCSPRYDVCLNGSVR
jgi:hypothetical protein